jgi:two-component system sensor histidine kinase YesM
LFILLPLVAISLFSNVRSREVLLEQTADRTKAALNSSMDYMDLTLQNVEEISTLVATDSNVLRLSEQIGANLTPQGVLNFIDILKQFANVTSINHIVSQMSIYHARSHIIVSSINGIKHIQDPNQQQWLQQLAVGNGSGISYTLPEDATGLDNLTVGNILGTDSISLVRSLDLNNPTRQPDLLIVTIDKNKLLNLIRSLLPSPQAQIYLYTNNQKLVTGTGSGDPNPLVVHEEDSSVFSVKSDSRYYNWSLVMLQPMKELYEETDPLRLYTYLIIGISVLLAFWISWAVYSGIASPVQRLYHGMRGVGSGKFNIQLENERKDEFGYLTKAFNQMVQNQKDLIENFYEQRLRLTDTELKFLQSQINPHFLYNTLDSIYWAAKNYEADEISEMVLNLSKFFRLSLNKGRDTFTVEETIAHLHYYVRVQQLRFLDKFSVEYEVQEESKTIPILKLLLQPLVENAILHGLEHKPKNGLLRISTRIEGDYLLLIVEDNGEGIPQERLLYIQEQLSKISDDGELELSFTSELVQDLYALRNVMSRIKMLYGPDANLTIDSAEERGTISTVSLPLERCQAQLLYSKKWSAPTIAEENDA